MQGRVTGPSSLSPARQCGSTHERSDGKQTAKKKMPDWPRARDSRCPQTLLTRSGLTSAPGPCPPRPPTGPGLERPAQLISSLCASISCLGPTAPLEHSLHDQGPEWKGRGRRGHGTDCPRHTLLSLLWVQVGRPHTISPPVPGPSAPGRRGRPGRASTWPAGSLAARRGQQSSGWRGGAGGVGTLAPGPLQAPRSPGYSAEKHPRGTERGEPVPKPGAQLGTHGPCRARGPGLPATRPQ